MTKDLTDSPGTTPIAPEGDSRTTAPVHVGGVSVFPAVEPLVEQVAADLAAAITGAIRYRGRTDIAITGGSTGIAVLTALTDYDIRFPGTIPWSRVHIWFGDERFVTASDRDRNELQARLALLDHVPLPPQNIHAIPARTDDLAEDALPAAVEVAAEYYEAELSQLAGQQGHPYIPSFDVQLLGMGGEGHINSIFPHTPALAETERIVVGVLNSPKPPPARITLTLPVVCASWRVWFVVSGEDKAQAVAQSVEGKHPSQWPSAGARGQQETHWYLDSAAASQL